MKEISAGGLVYHNHNGQLKVLLIEDRYGRWTLPKGKKEAGETDEENALREIKEETGIDGKIIDRLYTVEYQYAHPLHGLVDKQVTYYLVEAISEKETPQLEEIQGVTWLSAEEAWKRQQAYGYLNNQLIFQLAYQRLQKKGMLAMNREVIASMIDHTLLKPEATKEQIQALCEEAKTYQFASVCVNPYWVKEAASKLQGTEVKVCTVIGFPLGATTTEVKVFETQKAIEQGATEIDMVMNMGALKSGDLDQVKDDIAAVVEAAQGLTVKVILEVGLLSQDEIVLACELSKSAGAHFVKTSTGFGHGGATVEAVQLMRKTVGSELGVKASGGVRDHASVLKMIEAGANRIGASSGVAIVTGGQGTEAY